MRSLQGLNAISSKLFPAMSYLEGVIVIAIDINRHVTLPQFDKQPDFNAINLERKSKKNTYINIFIPGTLSKALLKMFCLGEKDRKSSMQGSYIKGCLGKHDYKNWKNWYLNFGFYPVEYV